MNALFGVGAATAKPRLLDFYSAEMLELALYRYGLLQWVRRLGYVQPRVHIDILPTGHRFRLLSGPVGTEDLLVEAILDRIRPP